MNVQEINNQLLFSFPERKTEAGILFGAKSVSGEIARHGASLYHKGAFQKIILTGGINVRELHVLAALSLNFSGMAQPKLNFTRLQDFTSSEREADYMRDVLLKNDVSDSDIVFVENQSKHTGANVENTRLRLQEFNSLGIVTTAYFQRRALGTIRKDNALNQPIVPFPVYPFGFTRDNWHKTLIKKLVNLESKRMDENDPKTYVNVHCINPDIEKEIEKSSSLPSLNLS